MKKQGEYEGERKERNNAFIRWLQEVKCVNEIQR